MLAAYIDSYFTLNMGPIDYSETSATTNLRCVTSQKAADIIYTETEDWNHVQYFHMFICFALVS
jgi:hypothetical protein